MPGNQKGNGRAQRSAHHHVGCAFQHAEHETRSGGQQHPGQKQHHGQHHDADKEESRPGPLGIKPAQKLNDLLMHTEGVKQTDYQPNGGNAPAHPEDGRLLPVAHGLTLTREGTGSQRPDRSSALYELLRIDWSFWVRSTASAPNGVR